ncbi:hypothetical protein M758_1G259200 [Ceratodon purpureus]|nr:hypothetical protein M758_1G259200 [Ceratodon purpureus]
MQRNEHDGRGESENPQKLTSTSRCRFRHLKPRPKPLLRNADPKNSCKRNANEQGEARERNVHWRIDSEARRRAGGRRSRDRSSGSSGESVGDGDGESVQAKMTPDDGALTRGAGRLEPGDGSAPERLGGPWRGISIGRGAKQAETCGRAGDTPLRTRRPSPAPIAAPRALDLRPPTFRPLAIHPLSLICRSSPLPSPSCPPFSHFSGLRLLICFKPKPGRSCPGVPLLREDSGVRDESRKQVFELWNLRFHSTSALLQCRLGAGALTLPCPVGWQVGL